MLYIIYIYGSALSGKTKRQKYHKSINNICDIMYTNIIYIYIYMYGSALSGKTKRQKM
jgi:hypothetical protein